MAHAHVHEITFKVIRTLYIILSHITEKKNILNDKRKRQLRPTCRVIKMNLVKLKYLDPIFSPASWFYEECKTRNFTTV